MSSSKLESLKSLLRSYGSCLVAYSGGVDSAFLAVVAHQVLGEKALAVIADSPSLPRREFDAAVALAQQFGLRLRVVHPDEFSNPDYVANPQNRCYFCKHELFSHLIPLAKEGDFAVICHGENVSDIGDFRPGFQAAGEFKARAPLKEVGLTKEEIREFSAQLGLPTAQKPQAACLSSRIPYGEPVTPEKLAMIEAAEYVLQDMGFFDVRVRHHEMSAPGRKVHLARIEVGAEEMPKFVVNQLFSRVAIALKTIGYSHVTLDLQGYRRGGFNELASVKSPVSHQE
jgi:uncharacterized protein